MVLLLNRLSATSGRVPAILALNHKHSKKSSVMRIDRRPKWDDALVDTALAMLKHDEPAFVAKKLNVPYHGMRKALSRRGYQLRQFLRKRPKGHRGRLSAFVKPSDTNRAFEAMKAMENDPGGCRFPIGDLDKGNFRFCGSDPETGSYCNHHNGIMRIKGSQLWTMAKWEKWEKKNYQGYDFSY